MRKRIGIFFICILLFLNSTSFALTLCRSIDNDLNNYFLDSNLKNLDLDDEYENKIPYTSNYSNITVLEAYNLINTSENLKIIDCRGLEGCSHCQFNKGHLPGAELYDNPTTLYQSTDDILVYSRNGVVGAGFCSDLLNHVYGKIYNLIGGYDAWFALGYPLEGFTYLQLMNLDNGVGFVSVDIINNGPCIAENISVEINVVGGYLSLINFTSSYIDCQTPLYANQIKKESTLKDGFILGLGPINITVFAWAKNANQVLLSQKGFIFGLLIFLK